MNEFKINKYITLRLEGSITVIYIKGKRFDQCKYLLLNIVKGDQMAKKIDSIDEMEEYLDDKLENQEIMNFDIEPEEEEDTVKVLRETRISLERDLESFIVEQIQAVETDLKLKEPKYRQVSVDSGIIDVLAEDGQGNMVIIELKAGQARDRVLAQILAYMSDITETYGNAETRGIIIANSFSDRLLQAVKIVPRVKLLRYGIKFVFEKP